MLSDVEPPERLRPFVAEEWGVLSLKENATDWEARRWHLLDPCTDRPRSP